MGDLPFLAADRFWLQSSVRQLPSQSERYSDRHNGNQTSPYTQGDVVAPLNIYRHSKAATEQIVQAQHDQAFRWFQPTHPARSGRPLNSR